MRKNTFTLRRGLALVVALGLLVLGPTRVASAAAVEAQARPQAQVVAIQLHLARGTPLLTIVTDGEVIDAEMLTMLDVWSQLDLVALVEQIQADTLAELGTVPITEDAMGHIDGLLSAAGLDFDAGATNVDVLDALLGLVGGAGSTEHPTDPAAGVKLGPAEAVVLVAVVIVVVIGGYGIGKMISSMPDAGVSGGPDGGVDEGDTTGAADGGVEPGGTGEEESEETPESLREAADEDDAAADRAVKMADEAEAEGDEDAAEGLRQSALDLREKARQKRAKADELEKQQNPSDRPDASNVDPSAFRAYLLALNPGLEGTEFDRLGQAIEYMTAYAAGERPVHSNPVPIDDGSDGDSEAEEVDIATLGCIGPGCGLVDPTEDTRNYSISPSMMEKVLAHGAPASPVLSYPPLDGGDPEPEVDGDELEPGSPGPGCEFC